MRWIDRVFRPQSRREILQYLHAAYLDLRLFVTGKDDPELPPLRLRFVGTGDFRAVGEHILAVLRSSGGLEPQHDVLDVGCGVGRVALPLARFLDGDARYEGFDIVPSWIRWCRKHITTKHPNFHFSHVDVSNTFYRRRGSRAAELRFPYDDASFDFAFATSVFTHLKPDAARHYVDELHRVLRPGGRVLTTFFLLHDDVRFEDAPFRFGHQRGRYRVESAGTPELAVAYDESFVREFFPASRWADLKIEHGTWGGGDGPTLQDVVVATRV